MGEALKDATGDPSSLSNPGSVRGIHLKLELSVEFEKRIIHGTASYMCRVEAEGATHFILDTSTLVISSVQVDGTRAKFMQRVEHPIYGSALEIALPGPPRAVGSTLDVVVVYHTSTRSTAVQWLPPAQTAGKEHPYLFTQCQAIHARSLLPCQDCPAAKLTYEATVEVPGWATCLMSALPAGEPSDVLEVSDASDSPVDADVVNDVSSEASRRLFSFRQPVPVPSYLIAVAVGQLESREISHRCRIWSEPSVVDAAAFDFSQTEEFLQAAESLTCPYQWGRYDLLCLPPSFPYGGMENPCCTFVTPTLLSGDKSLAFVVAHEISHSWTGNLITNKTWQSFWLNEGFTMWLERKIMSRVTGDDRYFDFDAQIGWNHLKEDVALFEKEGKAALTALCPPLEGIDPDDAFSAVPYEKGFALLYELQTRAGVLPFEAFVKAYIEKFKFGTITSEQFKEFTVQYFDSTVLDGLDWHEWFTATGMPKVTPKFDDSLCQESWQLAAAWLNCTSDSPSPENTEQSQFANWPSPQRVLFLEKLLDSCTGGDTATSTSSDKLTLPVLQALDKCYELTESKNAEVRYRWQLLCLKQGAEFIVPHVLDFVTSQGRMKFTRPLYRELAAHESTKDTARDTFIAHSDFYHPICRSMVAKDLGVRLPRTLSTSLSSASLSSEPLHALASEDEPAAVAASTHSKARTPKNSSSSGKREDDSEKRERRTRAIIAASTVIAVVAVVASLVLRRR